MKRFCEDKWGNDYSMREHCLSDQLEGFQEVIQWKNSNGVDLKEVNSSGNKRFKVVGDKPYTEMFQHCLVKWKADKGSHDWSMVSHCLSDQEESYDRIK